MYSRTLTRISSNIRSKGYFDIAENYTFNKISSFSKNIVVVH